MKFNISESDNGRSSYYSVSVRIIFLTAKKKYLADSVYISAVQKQDLTAVKINCSYCGADGGGVGANQINMSNWQKL